MSKRKIGSTIFKWSVLTLLIGYSAWITIWARRQADLMVCKSISINVAGSSRVDSVIVKGILSELDKFPGKIKGMPVKSINLQKIENYLTALSNFENVECMMAANGELTVFVTPMTPVMRVFSGDKSYYVNRAGKQIPTNADFYIDMPIVTGKFTKNFTPVDVLPTVEFVERDPELRNLVSMIKADDSRNILLVPRVAGHIINFGDTNNLARKRDALLLFYRNVMPYKGWNHYDTVSVKFSGQIVASRADKSVLNVAEEDYTEDIEMDEATLPSGISPNDTTERMPKPTAPSQAER